MIKEDIQKIRDLMPGGPGHVTTDPELVRYAIRKPSRLFICKHFDRHGLRVIQAFPANKEHSETLISKFPTLPWPVTIRKVETENKLNIFLG